MLGVTRALMSNPRVIVVDELSMGLAPQIVSQLFDILRDVNEAGTGVLIVDQFVHMALANTDRAYVLAKGEVVLEGHSAKVLADPAPIGLLPGRSRRSPGTVQERQGGRRKTASGRKRA